MTVLALLCLSCLLVSPGTAYSRVVLNDTFICSSSGAAFLNVSTVLVDSGQTAWGPLREFTLSLWVKVADLALNSIADIFSLFIPVGNTTLTFQVNPTPGTGASTLDLLLNRARNVQGWMVNSDQLFYGVSSDSLRTNANSHWEPLVVSFSALNTDIQVATKNTSFYRPFAVPGTFSLNGLYIILGGSTPAATPCQTNFILKHIHLYNRAFTDPTSIQEIMLLAPGEVFGIFKPQYSHQYNHVWFNLLETQVFRARGASLQSQLTAMYPVDHSLPPFQRANAPLDVRFLRPFRLSPVDQSYIFVATYGFKVNPNLCNSPSCPGYDVDIYRRLGPSGSPVRLVYRDTKYEASSSSTPAYTFYDDGVLVNTISTARINSAGFPNVQYNNTAAVVVRSNILWANDLATFYGLEMGTPYSRTVSAAFAYDDIHSISALTTLSDWFYLLYVWEISITYGSVVRHTPSGPTAILTVPSEVPFYAACLGIWNPKRGLPSISGGTVVFNDCTLEDPYLTACPTKPNCIFCASGGSCYNCLPNYALSSGSCVVCSSLQGANAVWDPVSSKCLAGQGTFDFTGVSYDPYTTMLNQLPKFYIFRIDFPCNNDPSYCPGSTTTVALYYNQLAEAPANKNTYNPSAAQFQTEYARLMTVVGRIQSPGNATKSTLVTLGTYQSVGSPAGTNLIQFTVCSIYGFSSNANSIFQTACFGSNGACLGGFFATSGSLCVASISYCSEYNLIGDCLRCDTGYVAKPDRACAALESTPNLLAPLVTPGATEPPINDVPIGEVPLTPTPFPPTIIPPMNSTDGFNPNQSAANTSQTSTNCLSIDPKCLECTGNLCRRCDIGFNLLANTCEMQLCTDPNCLNCPVATFCMVCRVGFEMTNGGTCLTIGDQKAIEAALSNPLVTGSSPSTCPANCLDCLSSGKCWKCEAGYSYSVSQNLCIPTNPNLIGADGDGGDSGDSVDMSDCQIWGNCTSSGVDQMFSLNCNQCTSCQYQSRFFCQSCPSCRDPCRCSIKSSTQFVGIIFRCPNVVFLQSYVSTFSRSSAECSLQLVDSDPGLMYIKPRKPSLEASLLVTPSFVESSFTCTFITPAAVRYTPNPQVFILSLSSRSSDVKNVYLARTGILFTVNILGNNLGQLLVALIELNAFFTIIGLLDLPIPGFYSAILTLSTDEEADPHDMSFFLPASVLPIYHFYNAKYRGYFIVNQTVLFVNTVTICFFIVLFLVKRLADQLPKPTFRGSRVLIRAARYSYLLSDASFDVICNVNFMGFCPGVYFFAMVFPSIPSFEHILGLAACICLTFVTSIYVKGKELTELFRDEIRGSQIPNPLRIASPEIYWLRFHNALEEVFQVVHLTLFYFFQHQKRFILHLTAAFCGVQVFVSLGLGLRHLSSVAALKTFQFLSMFGFIRLCIGMLEDEYVPHVWGFNILFLLSHGFKMASIGFELHALFRNLLSYREKLKIRGRNIREEVTSRRIRSKGFLRSIKAFMAKSRFSNQAPSLN